MTYVRAVDDASARWRISLAGVVAAYVVAAPGLRLWPFLGAFLLVGFWLGFGAGRPQGRAWRGGGDAPRGGGEAVGGG